MKKRIFSLLLTLTFIVSCFSSVVGADPAKDSNPTLLVLNTYLEGAGYPSEVIGYLEQAQKNTIYQNDLTYNSHKKAAGNLTDGEEEGMSSRSLSNFNQWITTSTYATTIAGQKKFHLSYNWNWAYQPNFTLTDKFGIAWTDGYDVVPSSIFTSYSAYGRDVNSANYHYNLKTVTKGTADAYTPGAGIGWSADILASVNAYDPLMGANNTFYTYSHQGYGECDIIVSHNKDGSYDSSSASGTYFHKQVGLTGSLTFSAPPAVEISPSVSYDKADDLPYQWNWYHN